MTHSAGALVLDATKCTGCGLCAEVCPHAVFKLDLHRAVIVNPQACMECGACQRNCRSGALSVETGVGCAAALISGILRNTAPCCGGKEGESCGC